MARRGTEYEVLAERQERLRLVRVTEKGRVRFDVEEVDADGVVVVAATYAKADLFAAMDEFDRRSLRLLEPPIAAAASIMIEMTNAVGGYGTEPLAELLDEEFRFVDHRPIGIPDLGRAELIELTADASGGRYLSRALHVVDEVGAVVTGGFWRENFDDWGEYFISAAIIMVEHGRVTLNELFPEDQLDAALARYAELTATPGTSA